MGWCIRVREFTIIGKYNLPCQLLIEAKSKTTWAKFCCAEYLSWLSFSQRRVFESLWGHWDPTSTGDSLALAESLNLPRPWNLTCKRLMRSLKVAACIMCLAQCLMHHADAQTWLSLLSAAQPCFLGKWWSPCWWTRAFLWILKLLAKGFLLETSFFFLDLVIQDFLGFPPNTPTAPSHSVLQSSSPPLTHPFRCHPQLALFSSYTLPWSGLIPAPGFNLCPANSQAHYLERLLFWSPDTSMQLPPRQVYTQYVKT